MDKIIKKFSLGFFMLAFSTISNSATLIVNNGSLMGATGVNVNGALYDVQFLDGTCAELYDGCDQISDFPFSNSSNDRTLLGIAMTALLEQVFIDSPLGNFDSSPALTNGCNVLGACQANTPLFSSSSTESIGAIGAFNSTNNLNDFILAGGVVYNSIHQFPEFDQNVFAVWSQSAVVPVPAAVWLFGSGLLGLVGLGRKRRLSN